MCILVLFSKSLWKHSYPWEHWSQSMSVPLYGLYEQFVLAFESRINNILDERLFGIIYTGRIVCADSLICSLDFWGNTTDW